MLLVPLFKSDAPRTAKSNGKERMRSGPARVLTHLTSVMSSPFPFPYKEPPICPLAPHLISLHSTPPHSPTSPTSPTSQPSAARSFTCMQVHAGPQLHKHTPWLRCIPPPPFARASSASITRRGSRFLRRAPINSSEPSCLSLWREWGCLRRRQHWFDLKGICLINWLGIYCSGLICEGRTGEVKRIGRGGCEIGSGKTYLQERVELAVVAGLWGSWCLGLVTSLARSGLLTTVVVELPLNMGVPVEFVDALEYYCDDVDYASDLTDAESDEECAYVPRVPECLAPRNSKRTSGAGSENGVVPERRVRRRIDEQLELLRAVIPGSCTDESASVLTDAYEYITELQRQVQELHSELDSEPCSDDDASSCEDDFESPSCSAEERAVDSNSAFEWSCASRRGRSRSRVEVVSTRGGLRIRVECDKRAGLLVEVMKVLESSGLNVEGAGVAFEERFVLNCHGSLVDRKRVLECRYVGSRLRSLITTTHA